MIKTLLATLLASIGLVASASDFTPVTTPALAAISTTNASSYAGTGGGLSLSGASNLQTASTVGGGVGSGGTALFTKYASVGVTGAANTGGVSMAGNVSTGNATGSAAASGISQASIAGVGAANMGERTGPIASVSGNAEAVTGTGAQAGTNGLGVSGGMASSSYDAGALATQTKLGPLNNITVDSHALTTAVTTPSLQIQVGNSSISIQNEAAANAFGQAKVGSVVSTH